MVDQVEGEVLEESYITLFVLDHIHFNIPRAHFANPLVVYVSVSREGQAREVVSQSQAFFSCLQTEYAGFLELFLFIAAKHDTGEHSLHFSFRVNSEFSDFMVSVVLNSLSVEVLNNVFVVNPFVLSVSRISQTCVQSFWNPRKIIFSLLIGVLHLLAQLVGGKLAFEFFKELLFDTLFNLGKNLAAEDEEVACCVVEHLGLVRRPLELILNRANGSSNRVSRKLASKVPHLRSSHQLVDWDGRLQS